MKDIPERREDGNWIRNIKFRFPLPILRDGKEVVRVDGISLDKEQPDEHTVTLEKFPTLETVVLLSQLKQKPDDYINVTIELDDMDVTSAETKVTYDEIKKYVAEHNDGMKVSNLYNMPKADDSKQPQCPEEKEKAIVEALEHFKMIQQK